MATGSYVPAKAPSPVATRPAVDTPAAFRQRAVARANELRASMDRFSALMESGEVRSPNWVANVATEGALWQSLRQAITHDHAPACLADVHGMFAAAYDLFGEAGSLVLGNYQKAPCPELALANQKMQQATQIVRDASALMGNATCP